MAALRSTPRPSRYAIPSRFLASLSPCASVSGSPSERIRLTISAARFNHMCASNKFRGTPSARIYILPSIPAAVAALCAKASYASPLMGFCPNLASNPAGSVPAALPTSGGSVGQRARAARRK